MSNEKTPFEGKKSVCEILRGKVEYFIHVMSGNRVTLHEIKV